MWVSALYRARKREAKKSAGARRKKTPKKAKVLSANVKNGNSRFFLPFVV
jgi:hypothetical protein